ncbi:MAG: hypothetical protein ABIH25_03650 [Candidatus Woesearchaeota archaeon]
MNSFIKILFCKKVVISLVFLVIISLFTFALYHSDATVEVTGNVIKTLAGE